MSNALHIAGSISWHILAGLAIWYTAWTLGKRNGVKWEKYRQSKKGQMDKMPYSGMFDEINQHKQAPLRFRIGRHKRPPTIEPPPPQVITRKKGQRNGIG